MDDQQKLEYGQWVIDDDGEIVLLEISHMGEDGVEVFNTNIPPEDAIELGEALAERGREML